MKNYELSIENTLASSLEKKQKELEITNLKSILLQIKKGIKLEEEKVEILNKKLKETSLLGNKIFKLETEIDLKNKEIKLLKEDFYKLEIKQENEKNNLANKYNKEIKVLSDEILKLNKKIELLSNQEAIIKDKDKLIVNLSTKIKDIESKHSDQLKELEFKYISNTNRIKDEAIMKLDNYFNSLNNVNFEYLKSSTKLTILQNYQLISENEDNKNVINNLLKEKEKLNIKNKELLLDIGILKQTKLNNKCSICLKCNK